MKGCSDRQYARRTDPYPVKVSLNRTQNPCLLRRCEPLRVWASAKQLKCKCIPFSTQIRFSKNDEIALYLAVAIFFTAYYLCVYDPKLLKRVIFSSQTLDFNLTFIFFLKAAAISVWVIGYILIISLDESFYFYFSARRCFAVKTSCKTSNCSAPSNLKRVRYITHAECRVEWFSLSEDCLPGLLQCIPSPSITF